MMNLNFNLFNEYKKKLNEKIRINAELFLLRDKILDEYIPNLKYKIIKYKDGGYKLISEKIDYEDDLFSKRELNILIEEQINKTIIHYDTEDGEEIEFCFKFKTKEKLDKFIEKYKININ